MRRLRVPAAQEEDAGRLLHVHASNPAEEQDDGTVHNK